MISLGEIELVLRDAGFDEALAKMARVDSAARTLGNLPLALSVRLPGADATLRTLADIGVETKTTERNALSAADAWRKYGAELGNALASARAGAVTAPSASNPRPTLGPRQLGPQPLAGPSLADQQAARVSALNQALAEFGSGSGKSAQDRATALAVALNADAEASTKSAAAAKGLSIAEREGADVTRLRVQALNELRLAQEAANQAVSAASIRTRGADLPASAGNAIAVGPQLGPATPDAEAFAARSRATAAAFEAEALAAQKATQAQGALAGQKQRVGAAADIMSPKVRSASNALSILAFGAATGEGSLRGIVAAGGLAATSLIEAFGPASVAVYASGIGAAVIALGTLVAVLHDAAQAAPVTKAALDHIGDIDRISSAREALQGVDRDIAAINRRIAEGQGTSFLDRLVHRRADNVSIAQDFLDSFGLSSADLRLLQTKLQQREALVGQSTKVTSNETKALAAANLDAVVQGLQAENRAREASAQAALATDAAQFALGRRSLDDFFSARLRTIEQARSREVSALAVEQQLKSAPVVGESPAEARQRAAEAKRITQEIIAVNARASQEATQTIEQRRQQREALDRQLLEWEAREADAAGDASAARVRLAQQEATAIARAMVQRGVDPVEADRRARELAETQANLVRFRATQQEAQRVFDQLETTRARINAEVERGLITQAEGNRQVAEAEARQVPVLDEILKRARAIAESLGNKDLVNQIDRATQDMRGLGRVTDPLVERFQSAFNQLASSAGASAKAARAVIEEEFARTGITIPLTIKTEALGRAAGSVDASFEQLGTGLGATFANALSTGISEALSKDSDKTFFEAFGNSVLQGMGSIFTQMGAELLTYGLIMQGLLPFLSNPFTSGPAAIAAGAALLALGAALGAIATNNTGHRTGGGRKDTAPRRDDGGTRRVILDPDQRIREERERERARAAAAPTVTVPASTAAQRVNIVNVHIGQINSLHPDEPMWQRNVGETMDNWRRRTGG